MQDTLTTDAAIAACFPCNNLWLRTATAPNCLMCGGAPSRLIPFPDGGAAGLELPPATAEEPAATPPPIDFTLDCPYCNEPVTVRVTDTTVELVVAAPAAQPSTFAGEIPPREPEGEPEPESAAEPEGEPGS